MTSTIKIRNANILVNQYSESYFTFRDPINTYILYLIYKKGVTGFDELLHETELSRKDIQNRLKKLKKYQFIQQKGPGLKFLLTEMTKNRIIYGLTSYDYLIGQELSADKTLEHPLLNSYHIKQKIGSGITSVTFCAEQKGVYRNRTIKIFKPGFLSYEELDAALKKRRDCTDNSIPEIIEAGQIHIKTEDLDFIVPVVVLHYISTGALTFREFLKGNFNISAQLLERYIEDVGGALAKIEESGLVHGDLHDGNILVVLDKDKVKVEKFWVIDFIGIPSIQSTDIEIVPDLENFRKHLSYAASLAMQKQPGISARRLLGNRVYNILQSLNRREYSTFKEMLRDFHKEPKEIPLGYFKPPSKKFFDYLKVEQIPDPELLFNLFEPLESRYEIISKFGNLWISGPKGCGKSHYLRILAFYPDVIYRSLSDRKLKNILLKLGYDFHKSFGILFTFRLGDFKHFTPEAINQKKFDIDTQKFLKHILILKIWNKTLNNIKKGLEPYEDSGKSIIDQPHNFDKLIRFFELKFKKIGIMEDTDLMQIFRQLVFISYSNEMSAISVWNHPELRKKITLLNEEDLETFFIVLKDTFTELKETKFFILVDDASFENMHREMQKILNSLVNSAQSTHCFKITCDKFMYTLETSEGRSIDLIQGGSTYVDLGEITYKYRLGQKIEYSDFSKYMANVINKHLSEAGFAPNIQGILGESQTPEIFLKGLRESRKYSPEYFNQASSFPKAYYGGWNILWNISHGSIRTMLELIEHIFIFNNISSNVKTISLIDQDKAVREYSKTKFQALSMLPGVIDGQPLGQKLQMIISVFGQISHEYLESYPTQNNEYYETISIEKVDQNELDPDANKILIELIKHGLFRDDGRNFSRSQFGLIQRYDMNKIFAPALETTYRVRNHFYLRSGKFEKLLLNPTSFKQYYLEKFNQIKSQTRLTDYVSL